MATGLKFITRSNRSADGRPRAAEIIPIIGGPARNPRYPTVETTAIAPPASCSLPAARKMTGTALASPIPTRPNPTRAGWYVRGADRPPQPDGHEQAAGPQQVFRAELATSRSPANRAKVIAVM